MEMAVSANEKSTIDICPDERLTLNVHDVMLRSENPSKLQVLLSCLNGSEAMFEMPLATSKRKMLFQDGIGSTKRACSSPFEIFFSYILFRHAYSSHLSFDSSSAHLIESLFLRSLSTNPLLVLLCVTACLSRCAQSRFPIPSHVFLHSPAYLYTKLRSAWYVNTANVCRNFVYCLFF